MLATVYFTAKPTSALFAAFVPTIVSNQNDATCLDQITAMLDPASVVVGPTAASNTLSDGTKAICFRIIVKSLQRIYG